MRSNGVPCFAAFWRGPGLNEGVRKHYYSDEEIRPHILSAAQYEGRPLGRQESCGADEAQEIRKRHLG